MAIEIEYCQMWNYRPEADRVSAEIAEQTDEEIELVAGGGGIFEIRRDGELLWKKQHSGHFPEPGEAAKLFA